MPDDADHPLQFRPEDAPTSPIVRDVMLHPGLYNGPKVGESKGHRIVRKCDEAGEPFFVLRAKDIFSVMAIAEYYRLIELYGPSDAEMQEGVAKVLEEFKAWQGANVSKVRYPD